MQYNTIQYNTMQYNTILSSTKQICVYFNRYAKLSAETWLQPVASIDPTFFLIKQLTLLIKQRL